MSFAIAVFSLACSVAAVSAVEPRKAMDFVIHKTAGMAVSVQYAMEDWSQGCPRRGFFESKLRGYNKHNDKAALARDLERNMLDFDDVSLIKSATIVRIAVGVMTYDLVSSTARALLDTDRDTRK